MMPEHEARLMELEMRVAFQEDTLQVLNDLLVKQRDLLDQFQRRLERLASGQAELFNQLKPADEAPPPHY